MAKSFSRMAYQSSVFPFSLNRVRKKNRTILKFLVFSLSIVGIGVSLVVFYVWQRVEVVKMEYQIELLQKEKEQLLRLNQTLYGDLLRLQSLNRIESLARDKLNLAPPGSEQVIFMKYPRGVKHD